MTEPLTFMFAVAGSPAPGGSKSAYPLYRGGKLVTKNGRPIIRIVDAGKKNKEWRAQVAEAARKEFTNRGIAPLTGALELHCTFYLKRPEDHFRAKRQIKPDAPRHHVSAPDTTKLLRSTEDALKGIAWVDDAQVIKQIASKRYADPNHHEFPGCIITIMQLE